MLRPRIQTSYHCHIIGKKYTLLPHKSFGRLKTFNSRQALETTFILADMAEDAGPTRSWCRQRMVIRKRVHEEVSAYGNTCTLR